MLSCVVQSGRSISPSNTVTAGPVISTGGIAAGPFDGQHAAARVARPPGVEQAQPDAGHHRRAGAGAAGQRLAGAALAHPQPDVARGPRTCMKPALTRCGKRGWCSISGPCVGDRRGVDVVHLLHRVRVAHRQHRDGNDGAIGMRAKRQLPFFPAAVGLRRRARRRSNGTRGRSNTGAPMSTVTRPSASRRGSITPRQRLARARVSLAVRPLSRTIAHEAARAVAALLDLAAVGVVDHVFEVDARRRATGRTDRIWSAPTPKWRSARKRYCAASRPSAAAGLVEHDEVVARALHLGEADSHGGIIRARRHPQAA